MIEQIIHSSEKKAQSFCISDYMSDAFTSKQLFTSGDKIKPIVYRAPVLESIVTEIKEKNLEGVLGKIGKVKCNTFLKPQMKFQSNFKPRINLWTEGRIEVKSNAKGMLTPNENRSVRTIGTNVKSEEDLEDMEFITPMKPETNDHSDLFPFKSHSQRQSRSVLGVSDRSLLSPDKLSNKEQRIKFNKDKYRYENTVKEPTNIFIESKEIMQS